MVLTNLRIPGTIASRMPGFEIRGRLNPEALPAWAFQRYKRATKKSDSEAVEYILERWINLDPEAERYGVSVEAFLQETEGAQVVQIGKAMREKKKSDAKLDDGNR